MLKNVRLVLACEIDDLHTCPTAPVNCLLIEILV